MCMCVCVVHESCIHLCMILLPCLLNDSFIGYCEQCIYLVWFIVIMRVSKFVIKHSSVFLHPGKLRVKTEFKMLA